MPGENELTRMLVREALKQGATDAVAVIEISTEKMIRFANNNITISKIFKETSATLHVRIGKKRAQASTTDISTKSLQNLVEKAVSIAKSSLEGDVYAPLPKGPFTYDKRLLKGSNLAYSDDELVEFVGECIRGALDAGAERSAGTLIYDTWSTYLRTSAGASAKAKGSTIEISTRAFCDREATGHFVSIAASKQDFKPYEAGQKAGEIAKMARNPEPGEPGEYEAVLGPMVFADLVEEVGDASSAFGVDAGISFLSGKLGIKVFSENFTLVDDPTAYNTYGMAAFDYEGVPTRRNTIIEDGVLKTYLHNSITARKFNTETTANAGLIVPHPFNLIVEPGSKTLEELISGVDRGIWITNDWYLRYQNRREGDFSTIPRDGMFLIRNGSVEKPIKDLRISDNMLRLFNNILELSRERYWITWWEVETPVLAPAAHIAKVNFMKSTI